MNQSKKRRRYVGAALAVGVSVSVCAATPAVAHAATTGTIGSVIDALTSGGGTAINGPAPTATATPKTGNAAAASPDLTLPVNETVNLAVSGLGTDGAPVIAFLRDALDLASEFAAVDTGSGVIRILDALLNGSTGADGTLFDASSLPYFLKQLENGAITGDTTGVQPGKYTIKGTLTDLAGREVPVELTLSVGEGTDTPAKPTTSDTAAPTTSNTAATSTAKPVDATATNTAKATTPNTAAPTTSNTVNAEPSDKANSGDSTAGDLRYADTEVKAGSSVTVKPEGAATGTTFVSSGNPDWVKVNPTTGDVTLAPTDGTAAGENEITVGYSTESVDKLLSAVNKGDLSGLEKTAFTATVTREGNQSDATANTVNTAQGTAQGNGQGGEDAAAQPASNKAAGGTGTAAGTAPTYVGTSQKETLPVTGTNTAALGVATLMLVMLGGAAVLMGARRANRA